MLMTESFNLQLDDLLERICGKLQISPTQHQRAEDRYRAIGDWLEAKESLLVAVRPDIYPQGSLRIGTTVRPLGRQEYDLDLVCEVQLDCQRVRNPVALLDVVESRFKQHEVYRGMLERKNRCIRIRYANEFHLDILPACQDPVRGIGCVVVPDREAKVWKPSNPKGFAAWFESRAKAFETTMFEKAEPLPGQEPLEVKAPLKRVVQLLKRWRDITYARTQTVAPISIVLTALAGYHYGGEQSVNEALLHILDGVVASLPPNGRRLVVVNPANPEEDLSERWDDEPWAYQAFVSGIVNLRRLWQSVNQLHGIHQVTAVLEHLFGEDVTKSVVKEQAQFIQEQRSGAMLGVRRGSGILRGVATAGVVPIPRNTFHGI